MYLLLFLTRLGWRRLVLTWERGTPRKRSNDRRWAWMKSCLLWKMYEESLTVENMFQLIPFYQPTYMYVCVCVYQPVLGLYTACMNVCIQLKDYRFTFTLQTRYPQYMEDTCPIPYLVYQARPPLAHLVLGLGLETPGEWEKVIYYPMCMSLPQAIYSIFKTETELVEDLKMVINVRLLHML